MADRPEQRDVVPSPRPTTTPDRGPVTDPNPGERSVMDANRGVPINSLGARPATGNRAGGGQQIDVGAQVGVLRSLEFTAGGRAHRLSTGTYSSARPAVDPKSGEITYPTAVDSDNPTLGPREKAGPPAMPEAIESTPTDDSSTGNINPDRRRDKRGT